MKGFFYTNVQYLNKKMYVRGYKDGIFFNETVQYKPTIFVPSPEDTGWRSLQGERLKPVRMQSIDSMVEYVTGVGNSLSIHGFTSKSDQVYALINEMIPDEVRHDSNLIRKLILDIEIESDGGFPDVWEDPFQRINAITIWMKDLGYITWGLHNSYTPEDEDVEYRRFDDEGELLHDFCKTVAHENPDIVSGWNTDGFDIPYIINRITKHFNPDWVKLLSPWKLKPKEISNRMGERTYDIPGVTSYDYMRLYKKFNLAPRESYSLNAIASVELGEKKVDYSEFSSLLELYKNDWKKFIDYNIHDVRLVSRLDEKLKFFDLAIVYAYIAKVNLSDVFGTVKYWDVYIHNHLYKKKIAIPSRDVKQDNVSYPGGFVKDPHTGLHEWIASFDLNSLYPNIIVQYNISPETILNLKPYPSKSPDKEDIIQSILDETIDRTTIEKYDASMAANGWYFTKEKQGFLPEMVESVYSQRKDTKDKMLEIDGEIEQIKNEIRKRKS